MLLGAHPDCVVCGPHFLGPNHIIPLLSFPLPIHGTLAKLLRSTRLASTRVIFYPSGLRRQNHVVLLYWKHHLDYTGIYPSSILVSH
jgi:hypothetical protein